MNPAATPLPGRTPIAARAFPSAAARPLQVERIQDRAAFLGMERAWNEIVAAARHGSPFLRHEWLSTWWEAFASDHQLQVMLVKDGREPVGLAPFMTGAERWCGLEVKRLELIGNVHTPRFEIVASRSPEAASRAVWAALRELDWDVLQLRDLPRDGGASEGLAELARADGFLTGVWPSLESPVIRLRGPWSTYFRGLRAKHRSNLRNRLKRLNRLGEVTHEMLTAPSADDLDAALLVEAAGWKGRAGTAIAARPDTERFYRLLAARASASGWLRLHFLRVGGRRIAFQYTLEYADRIWVLKLGHDPALAPLSPQNLLCGFILEDAFARGLQSYEFLGQREDWKMEWASETVPHDWLYVFRDTRLGRLLHALKCRLLPALQKERVYRLLRDATLRRRAIGG